MANISKIENFYKQLFEIYNNIQKIFFIQESLQTFSAWSILSEVHFLSGVSNFCTLSFDTFISFGFYIKELFSADTCITTLK